MDSSFRTTFILFIAAIAVSIWAYVFERDAPPWEEKGGVFGEFTETNFVELRIVPGRREAVPELGVEARPILLRHERSRVPTAPDWRIVEPIDFPAYTARIDGLLLSIIELERIAPVPPEEVADGFDAEGPLMTIHFKTRNPEEGHTIEVGKDYADASISLAYFRVDGTDSFLSSRRFKKSFRTSLDELRSRALFPVPRTDALRLKIRRSDSEPLVMARKEAPLDWRIEEGHRGLADREILGDLLDRLNSWRIESFVTDRLEDPSRYGFDRPRLTVELTQLQDVTYRLEVADDPRGELDGEVYVRDPERPHLFTAKDEILEKLERPPEEFRSRYLLQLGASRIVEVRGTVVTGGEERRFRLWMEEKQDAGKRDGEAAERTAWKVEDARLEETWDADRLVSRGFLDRLRHLEVRRYIDEPSHQAVLDVARGRASSLLELRIELEEARPILLRFYAAPADPDFPEGSYLATRQRGKDPLEDGELTLITTALPSTLAAGGIHFRDRSVSTFDAGSVEEFEIESGTLGIRWNLALLGGDTWRLGEDDRVRKKPDATVNQELVESAISALSKGSFSVGEFLPDATDLERLELTRERSRIRVWLTGVKDPGGFEHLTVGAQRGPASMESYGTLDTVSMPVVLRHGVVKVLVDLVKHLDGITMK